MGMKFQLKNLCQKNEIEFLEIDIDKESILDRSGLHLNFRGQDRVARSIFKHSRPYTIFKLDWPIYGWGNK